jgi:hypothetical protein
MTMNVLFSEYSLTYPQTKVYEYSFKDGGFHQEIEHDMNKILFCIPSQKVLSYSTERS